MWIAGAAAVPAEAFVPPVIAVFISPAVELAPGGVVRAVAPAEAVVAAMIFFE